MFSLNCNWPLTGLSFANLLGFQFTLHNTVMVLFTKCNSNHFILYYPALRVYRIKCKLLRKSTKICIYLVLIYQSVSHVSLHPTAVSYHTTAFQKSSLLALSVACSGHHTSCSCLTGHMNYYLMFRSSSPCSVFYVKFSLSSPPKV